MTLNLDFLSQYFTEVHFDKDTLITCVGDVEHSLYYLSEGIVRFFYYNPTTDPAATTTTPDPVEFILNTITPLPWYMRLMGAASLGALIMSIVMARPQKKRPRPQGDA